MTAKKNAPHTSLWDAQVGDNVAVDSSDVIFPCGFALRAGLNHASPYNQGLPGREVLLIFRFRCGNCEKTHESPPIALSEEGAKELADKMYEAIIAGQK